MASDQTNDARQTGMMLAYSAKYHHIRCGYYSWRS